MSNLNVFHKSLVEILNKFCETIKNELVAPFTLIHDDVAHSSKRLRKLQDQAKKLRNSGSPSPLGLSTSPGLTSGPSFIRLHKEKAVPSSPTAHEDPESEYIKALRSVHRKLSMQCTLTYTTFFSSFEALFNTGKASLTRMSSDFDRLNSVVKRYDVARRYSVGGSEITTAITKTTTAEAEAEANNLSSLTSSSSPSPLPPQFFLSHDNGTNDVSDCVIDDVNAPAAAADAGETSSPGAVESMSSSRPNDGTRLRMPVDSCAESVCSRGSSSDRRSGYGNYDAGSSVSGLSGSFADDEPINNNNNNNICCVTSGNEECHRVFTTRATAGAMIAQLVDKESKYMLDLTLLNSLHNKLVGTKSLVSGKVAQAVETVFSKLPMLVDAEIALSNKLEACLTEVDPLYAMHRAFEACKGALAAAYPEYIRNYPDACAQYKRVKRRPCVDSAVRTFLKQRTLDDLLAVPCTHIQDLRVLLQGVLEGVAPLAKVPDALAGTIAVVDRDLLPPVTEALAFAGRAKAMLRVKALIAGADNRVFDPAVRTFLYDGTAKLYSVSPARGSRAMWPEDINKSINAKLVPGYDYHIFVFNDVLLVCRDIRSALLPSPPGISASGGAGIGGSSDAASGHSFDYSLASVTRSGSGLSRSSGGGSSASSSPSNSSSSSSSSGFGDSLSDGDNSNGNGGDGSNGGSSGDGSGGGGVGDNSGGNGKKLRRRYEICAQFSVANVEASQSGVGGKPIPMPSVGPGKYGARRFIVTYRTNAYAFIAPSASQCNAWVKCLRNVAGKRAATQVFGVPLGVVMAHESESDNDIPAFLRAAFSTFEASETACMRKGIFRVNSSELIMTQLMGRIDAGETPAAVLAGADPLLVANMIKKWFHMLPKAVIFFEDFNEALESKDLDAFKTLIDTKLTPTERFIVMGLFATLRRIKEHKKENEMNLHNLCVVTAPFLIRPCSASSAMLCSGTSAAIVKFIFKNFDILFKDVALEHSRFVRHAKKRSQTQASVPFIRESPEDLYKEHRKSGIALGTAHATPLKSAEPSLSTPSNDVISNVSSSSSSSASTSTATVSTSESVTVQPQAQTKKKKSKKNTQERSPSPPPQQSQQLQTPKPEKKSKKSRNTEGDGNDEHQSSSKKKGSSRTRSKTVVLSN